MELSTLMTLAFGHFAVDALAGALPVLIPLLKEQFSLSYTMAGSLMLLAQLSSSVIQPLFGLWSDHVSLKFIMPASLVIASLSYLLIGFGTHPAAVLIGVACMGLGVAAYHPEASKIAHYTGGEQKAWAVSVFAIGGNVGSAFGPMFMGVLLLYGGMHGVIGLLGIGLPAALLFYWLQPRLYRKVPTVHETSSEPKLSSGTAPRTHSLTPLFILLGVIMLRSWTMVGMVTFIPLYYVSYLGLEAQAASTYVTTFLAAGALGTVAGGWLGDRWGRRRVILASMAAAVPFTYVFPTTSGVFTFITLALAGGLLISSSGVTTVLGQELLRHRIGLASGLMLGFSVGTGGIGATLLGLMADTWGIRVAVSAIAFVPFGGALLALGLPRDLPLPREPVHLPGQA